jgi:hypothetical protein
MGIYLSQLQKYPVYKKPPTYEIDEHAGIGSAFDPPGYPSHGLHSVYTQYGNNPHHGSTGTVLYYGGLFYAMPIDFYDKRDAILRKLWIPEPIESEPVQAWVKRVKAHYKHCYVNPEHPSDNYHAKLVYWPVSKFNYPLRPARTFKDWRGNEYAMSDSDYRKACSVYRAQVKAMLQAAWKVASNPDNDAATVHIREFYPDYKPE